MIQLSDGTVMVQNSVSGLATATISIASPAVVTCTAHGLVAGSQITFMTTGSLPTGLTAYTTTYFVLAAGLTVDTFRVSTTNGGAAINTSGTQTGTHTVSGVSSVPSSSWFLLTPDASGSYAAGTWTQLANMNNTRQFYPSQVLRNGRVLVAGGEYGNGRSLAEIYNPVTGLWTATPNPTTQIANVNVSIVHSADGTASILFAEGADNPFVEGQFIDVAGVTPAGLNGNTLRVTAVGTLTVTVNNVDSVRPAIQYESAVNANLAFSTGTVSARAVLSDANSAILNDGRVIVGVVDVNPAPFLQTTRIYNPNNDTWIAGPSTVGIHNESTWVKLPNNGILMVDRGTRNSEIYTPGAAPAIGAWTADAILGTDLYATQGEEVGGGMLLPNGNVIMFGGTQHNARWAPPVAPATSGTWTTLNDFPTRVASGVTYNLGMPDGPVAMLPNGRLLLVASPIPINNVTFRTPTFFFEYNPGTDTYTDVTTPTGAAWEAFPCYTREMLVLPNGSVLCTNGSRQIDVYQTTGGATLNRWRPTLAAITTNLDGGGNFVSYHLTGRRINGISEGAIYGDDWQNNTNYPIVRLTQGTNVFYARTFDWDSTRVSDGSTESNTDPLAAADFTLPAGLAAGNYGFEIVANGIPSNRTTVTYGGAVTRTLALSNNAELSALTVSSGTLPTFSSGTTSYSFSVGTNVTALTVTPTVSHVGATITVNGNDVTSGSASGSLSMGIGSNTVTIVVTAPDRTTTKTYELAVLREDAAIASITSRPGWTRASPGAQSASGGALSADEYLGVAFDSTNSSEMFVMGTTSTTGITVGQATDDFQFYGQETSNSNSSVTVRIAPEEMQGSNVLAGVTIRERGAGDNLTTSLSGNRFVLAGVYKNVTTSGTTYKIKWLRRLTPNIAIVETIVTPAGFGVNSEIILQINRGAYATGTNPVNSYTARYMIRNKNTNGTWPEWPGAWTALGAAVAFTTTPAFTSSTFLTGISTSTTSTSEFAIAAFDQLRITGPGHRNALIQTTYMGMDTAIDSNDTIYILQMGMHPTLNQSTYCVYKIVPNDDRVSTPVTSTIWPNSIIPTSSLWASQARLAIDRLGDYYVAIYDDVSSSPNHHGGDSGNKIYRIKATEASTVAGLQTAPVEVAVGAGSPVTNAAAPITLANPSAGDGAAPLAALIMPSDIAFDYYLPNGSSGRGRLYIADRYTTRVRRVDFDQNTINTIIGGGSNVFPVSTATTKPPILKASTLSYPGTAQGMALDRIGNVFLNYNFTIIKVRTPATLTGPSPENESGTIGDAQVIAGNTGRSPNYGEVMVNDVDATKYTVEMWPSGGLSVDSNGHVYFVDIGYSPSTTSGASVKIRMITPNGNRLITIAGNNTPPNSAIFGPGPALTYPLGVIYRRPVVNSKGTMFATENSYYYRWFW